MFACEQEGVAPDFLCLAKGLTGGYMPLAATLTTERVHDGFLGEYEEFRTFFHGHTYTGNPLACAAALATLDVFEQERTLERLAAEDGAAASSSCATWSSRCRTWRRSAAWASCAASSWPTATGGPTTRRSAWATASRSRPAPAARSCARSATSWS